MARERDIAVVLSALAAAGLLVLLFSAPAPQDSVRVRRDEGTAIDDADDYEYDEGCESFSFNTDGSCDMDDNPNSLGRTGGAEASAKRGKKNRGPKASKAPTDNSAFFASSDANTAIDNLVVKMERYLSNFHKKTAHSSVASMSPDASTFDYSDAEVAQSTADAWNGLLAKGGSNCAYGAGGRLTSNTKAVFMLYPVDMAYITGSINNNELMAAYKGFFNAMESHTDKSQTTLHVGTYAANSAVKVYDLKDTSAVEKMNEINGGQFLASMRGKNLRVMQPNIGKVFGKFLLSSKKYTKRSMDGGVGDTCFAVMIIHTLPTDYKDFANGAFENNVEMNCHLIPVFVVPDGQGSFFSTMAANFASNGGNMDYSNNEAGLKSFHMMGADSSLAGNMNNAADQMISYMCGVENRVQCQMSKPAWFEAEPDLDRGITTTTEGTTTTDFTTSAATTSTEQTTTEGTTTTAGMDTTSQEADMVCCGCSAGASSYDANSEFCSVCDGAWVVGEC